MEHQGCLVADIRGGVTVEIVGRLNALLGEQAYPHNVRGVWGKMVARDRYIVDPTHFEHLFSKTYRAACPPNSHLIPGQLGLLTGCQ